jgi:hypothetical protein
LSKAGPNIPSTLLSNSRVVEVETAVKLKTFSTHPILK